MDRISPYIQGLLEACSANETFVGAYEKLLKSSFLCLLDEAGGQKGIDQLLTAVGEDEDARECLKEGFNVLVLSIAEFRRKNLVAVEIEVVLKDSGFSEEMSGKFMQRFEQFLSFANDKDNERSNLFDSSVNFDKLVDVEWRQEYVLSTKYIKHLNKDNYHISLTTLNESNAITPVNFKCSLEQLTELVNKLGAAVKNIEAAADLRHLNQANI